MQVKTSRFGTLEVPEDKVINFAGGFLGFPELREYFYVPVADNPFFTWLQSVQDPAVAFLLVNPFPFFPDYEFDFPESCQKDLEIEKKDDIVVFTTVTIPPTGVKDMTTNLVGPVIINQRLRKGMQLVLENTSYTTKHPLFTKSLQKRAQGE